MHTGSVNYSARTSGIQIDKLIVQSDHPNIRDFVCSISKGGKISLEINLEDIYYEDWKRAEVIEEVRQFIAILSFEFDIAIQSLREVGYSIKKTMVPE